MAAMATNVRSVWLNRQFLNAMRKKESEKAEIQNYQTILKNSVILAGEGMMGPQPRQGRGNCKIYDQFKFLKQTADILSNFLPICVTLG